MSAEPRVFQQAAVDLVVERLGDRHGPRRFLVADEVGLGKTIVTCKVIEALRKRSKHGLVVAYVCSNREIAEQNRPKLGAEGDEQIEVDRLTLLASKTRELRRARDLGAFRLLSITPQTSLEVGRGTGRTEERLLLLDMLRRHLRYQHPRLSRFLRCQAGEQRWRILSRNHSLIEGCSAALVQRVKEAWRRERAGDNGMSILTMLEECLATPEIAWKKNRRKIIGQLRLELARAVLHEVDIDLVVLDEFQRFPDVIRRASAAPETLDHQLLARSAALLLSATPYRLYTAGIEKGEHHRELMTLLGFLLKADPKSLGLQAHFNTIASELRSGGFLEGRDSQLRAAKEAVEKTLRKVMCRTERNWYATGAAPALPEHQPVAPGCRELADYFSLDEVTTNASLSRARSLDYWKSAPLPLAFMDAGYELSRQARRQKLQRQHASPRSLEELCEHNGRLERFRKLALGEERGTWKHLWVRPSYNYYVDEHYGSGGPDKYLVFSHWRFVPKMLAVSLSHEVGKSIRPLPKTSPLSPKNARALSILKVCFPSTFLAGAVNPLKLATRDGGTPTADQLVARAAKHLVKVLEADRWTVVGKGGVDLWTVVATQEDRPVIDACIGLKKSLGEIRNVARTLARLEEPDQRLVSRATVRELAEIALFSPAVSLARAIGTTYDFKPDGSTKNGRELIERLLSTCLESMRLYFNRPTIQKIVRVHGRPGEYVDRVLRYCRRTHVAAMWDEYVALLKNPGQCGTIAKALEQISRVLQLGQGNPKLNVVGRRGKLQLGKHPATSDYAMAFGEELETEASQASVTQRRTRVREAFNSPFWPFVLATTSVGQEGLDFHLYCQDVVHWSLPTNPVDFEQREGRVNRYAGLWVRRRIAQDYPLAATADGRAAPWPGAFLDAEAADTPQKYKHGLYPYWVYDTKEASVDGALNAVRRHLIFYGESEDRLKYDRLLLAVSLYRLVFGQPDQEELLAHLRGRLERDGDRTRALELLPAYTINLSPMRDGAAIVRARTEAKQAAAIP
jgi:hypothetical protein